MTDSERRGKKRPTLVEGFNNVPNILEEARRAVDDVTQGVQNQGGEGETPAALEGQKGGGAGPKRPKAAPRKKSAKESGRQKKPSRPPASKEQPAVPPTPPAALDICRRAQLGLAHFGITVKHAIPGRIRLRLYQMLHNEALAEKLPSLLAAVPGLFRWRPAPTPVPCSSLIIPRNWLRSKVAGIWPGLCNSSSRGST